MKKTTKSRIAFKLDDTIIKKLEQTATEQGRGMSEIIRELIAKYVKNIDL